MDNHEWSKKVVEEMLSSLRRNLHSDLELEGVTFGKMSKFMFAIYFAADKHRNQRRKDLEAIPYINHPIALAFELTDKGKVSDFDVLTAAVLHDTLEDTATTERELLGMFGAKITSIVLEVTDDKTLSKQERKQKQIEKAPNSSKEAKLIKLADKLCNLQDILLSPPADWSKERKVEYFDWAEKVVNGMRGTNEGLEGYLNTLFAQGRWQFSQ
jgi:GTP diphosphokinase / guanosine-3',5'-bis(diphosphate) 3'-diphosphatase